MNKIIIVFKILVNLIKQGVRLLLFVFYFMWQGETFGSTKYEEWGKSLNTKLKLYLNELK